MKQDVLYIRDVVSKTITLHKGHATIITDMDDDELVIPSDMMDEVKGLFDYAYNRADDFKEGKSGNVYMSISGGQYPDRVGDVAQRIWEKARI